MTLVVNLVRTVLSAKFICCCWRSSWCDFRVTHTPKCKSKYRQIIKLIIINCGLTILIVSLFSLCRLQNTAQLRSGAVDKSIFLQNEYFYKTNLPTSGVTRALNQGGQSFAEGGLSVTVGRPLAKIRKKK